MKIDVVVAEIGSTTTIVNAFNNLDINPVFIGQGFAPTTVHLGDVNIGLNNALHNLKEKLNVTSLNIKESFACSSAAGGLKMSVHGLVYDMTVKAAREAALGAGANISFITAGVLSKYDLEKIKSSNLNIIMIAGGVDYGESKTALSNARSIAKLQLKIPIIYAGNIVNHEELMDIFKSENQIDYLYITENVYPRIDELNVEPSRKIIQDVFEKHITEAPGMKNVRNTISKHIIPVPGAVLNASILLNKHLGNLLTIDVGGATTDIHSVCEDSTSISKILIAPEPFSKRTVEGDLGVYINKDNIFKLLDEDKLKNSLELSAEEYNNLKTNYHVIPKGLQEKIVERLTVVAVKTSLERHIGKIVNLYGPNGKTTIAQGKDLTEVKYIIGTGGPLTRLSNGKEIITEALKSLKDDILKPSNYTKVLIDHEYIMATLGTLSLKYPEAALKLLLFSLKVGE